MKQISYNQTMWFVPWKMTDKDISPKISIQHSIEKHSEYREERKMEKKIKEL